MKNQIINRFYLILILVSLIVLLNNCSKDEVNPEDEKFIAISAHGGHSLALKSDSTLWAWGANGKGELGDGTLEDRNKPVWIGNDFIAIAAGGNVSQSYDLIRHDAGYSLALKADGTLWAWGFNGNGQLGDGTYENKLIPEMISCCYTAIAAGDDHSFGIKTDGTLWAWGSNEKGKLGIGEWTGFRSYPVQVGSDFMAVSAGSNHSLALKTDGSLWTWGFNYYGELGDGTNIDKNIPVYIGDGYSAISARGQSFAIKTNGTMWAWGPNYHSELGDGSEVNRNIPIEIGSSYVGSRFTEISTAGDHTLALKTENTLWAWGCCQLGDGVWGRHGIPFQVGTGYISISAGSGYSLGLKTDGTLWAWGDNTYGQLGDGSNEFRNTPVKIGGH